MTLAPMIQILIGCLMAAVMMTGLWAAAATITANISAPPECLFPGFRRVEGTIPMIRK
jgi:hypothetical protein